MPYGELIDHALPARELLTLLFPFLYGGVPNELVHVPAWGKGPWRNELMGYVGLGTLMLARWKERGSVVADTRDAAGR